jgi:hypothetical protein
MILYDPHIPTSLSDFGILIPVRDSRATKTFETLCRHLQIGSRKPYRHIPIIQEKLTREDLARVHAPQYLDRLYSEALADEILTTYELIDPQGHYNRIQLEAGLNTLSQAGTADLAIVVCGGRSL